jgi:hypothetical protein
MSAIFVGCLVRQRRRASVNEEGTFVARFIDGKQGEAMLCLRRMSITFGGVSKLESGVQRQHQLAQSLGEKQP